MIRSATANPRSAWIKVSSNSCSVALSSFFLVKIEVIEPPMDDDDFDRPCFSRENQPLRCGTSATFAGALTGNEAGIGAGVTLTACTTGGGTGSTIFGAIIAGATSLSFLRGRESSLATGVGAFLISTLGSVADFLGGTFLTSTLGAIFS